MKSKLVILMLIVLSSLSLHAQNIIQFNYSLNNTYSHLENALLEKQLLADEYVNYRYLLFASINYVDDPLIVKDITLNQRESVLISNYTTVDFGAAFHITKSFVVGFQSGFTKASINNFNPNTLLLTGTTDEESTLNDTKLVAKWRITDAEKGFAIALIPHVRLATGNERSFTTDRSTGFGLDVAFETIIGDTVQVAANVGYHYSPDAFFIQDIALDYRDKIHTAIGAYIPFSKDFGANLEFTRYWVLSSNDDQNPNEFYGGLRYQAATPLALFAGMAIGNMDSSKDSNDFKFSAGLKFHGGAFGPVQAQAAAEIDAIDDRVIVPFNRSKVIDALQNDLITDPSVGYLRIVSNSAPQRTKCEIVENPLAVRYTPTRNYVGTSVCRYEYCTSTKLCDEADITITVNPPKAKLQAIDDTVIAPLGRSTLIDNLANDRIPRPANGYLRIVSNSHPNRARCEIVESPYLGVKYTPITNFLGSTVCRYEYCTADKVCDQADITIRISAPVIKSEPYGNLVWNKSIYFCNDCDYLDARSKRVTEELKNYIASRRGKIEKVVIEGHTSLAASKAYNLNLSKRRARNTYKQLRKLGIPPELISMVAYGESRPEIKSFEADRKHPTNRRVEFRLYERLK